jgi:hypothetical protein
MEGYPQHGDQHVDKASIRAFGFRSHRPEFWRVSTGRRQRRWRGSRSWRRGYNWRRNDRRRNAPRRGYNWQRNDRRRNAPRRGYNWQRNDRRRNARRRGYNWRAALIHSQSHRP